MNSEVHFLNSDYLLKLNLCILENPDLLKITKKNFLTKTHFFVISKMAKNQFFEQGKKFKTACQKCNLIFFREIDLFDFT